jgi:hypothetical protein
MYHHKLTATSDGHVFGLAVANTIGNHDGKLMLAKIAGTPFSATGIYNDARYFKAGDLIDGSRDFFGFGTMAVDASSGQFVNAVDGFVGFSFDDNGDTRYGWLRVITSGGPENSFKIMEYAYAGSNEGIEAGQVPEPGSLGLLATGGIGLLLWRKRRANRKSA